MIANVDHSRIASIIGVSQQVFERLFYEEIENALILADAEVLNSIYIAATDPIKPNPQCQKLWIELQAKRKEKENYFTLSGSNYSIDVGNLDIFESQSNEIIVYKNILIMEKFIDELDTNFVFIHSNNNSIKEETKFNVANIYN